MVWIGHCSGSNDIQYTNYQPGTVVWDNNPNVPVSVGNNNEGGITQIDGNGDDRHCVGLSLGALVGIIIGVFLFAMLIWVVVRCMKKKKAEGGGAEGGGEKGPGFMAKVRRVVHSEDPEKGNMGAR